jgi:hypothetical protein
LPTRTVPSLQGTLVKPTKPTLQQIFAKEPFHLSRSNDGLKDCTNMAYKLIEKKPPVPNKYDSERSARPGEEYRLNYIP